MSEPVETGKVSNGKKITKWDKIRMKKILAGERENTKMSSIHRCVDSFNQIC